MNAIVLLSGGLDSAVCLHWALTRFESVSALAIDYGQRHGTELVSARRIASAAGVDLEETRAGIPWMPSGLTPKRGHLGGDDVVVHGRNMILASLAAMRVLSGTVVMGCCANDADRFPDCRSEYIDALSHAMTLSLNVRVVAPLVNLTKADTLRMAKEIGGAWEAVALSWSCYMPVGAGARRPVTCGWCLACTTRAAAFEEIGEPDPAAR